MGLWSRALAALLSEHKRLELYPPFRHMRVKVVEMSDDRRRIRLKLPLGARTRNPGGSVFGGCQAALADPIAALACARVFRGHSVWTRHLSLDFKHQGNTDLELRFELLDAQLAGIRAELEATGRATPRFEYGYYRDDGSLCTAIECRVAIRPRGYVKNPDAAVRAASESVSARRHG